MGALDLVVTCDTSVAHLAGALARPIWVALKQDAEWRWLRDRDDSPWYPTMRLFRQIRRGDLGRRLRRRWRPNSGRSSRQAAPGGRSTSPAPSAS